MLSDRLAAAIADLAIVLEVRGKAHGDLAVTDNKRTDRNSA